MNLATKIALEQIVDDETILSVVAALSEICHEKAEHIQQAYNDKPLARMWDGHGRALNRAAVVVDARRLIYVSR